MAQHLILTSDKKQVSVAPGAKTEFSVTIQNLTTLLDDVALSVSGIDPAWVEVVPAHAPVFAQGEAAVRVIIKPPLDSAAAQAGIYPLQVTGRSQEQAGAQAAVNLDLEIQFIGDYRIEVGSGTPLNPLEATFPVKIRNEANASLTLRCTGADPQNAFWYKFDPFQINVPAGGETIAQLGIRSRQAVANAQQVTFSVSAQGEWAIGGSASYPAPAHQVSGQRGQAGPAILSVEIRPYPQEPGGQARYQVIISNPGPAAESAVLEGGSQEGLLGFQFDPSQVSLAPASRTAVNLLVWLAQNAANQPAQFYDFWVTARPQTPHTRPGSARARFNLPAVVPVKKRPAWVIPAIIAALLLMALCLVSVVYLVGQLRSFGGF